MLFFFFSVFFIALVLLLLFFSLSKSSEWNFSLTSTFECGFTSYFSSRYSFSIQYYVVMLIFLFLDLELCLIMPMLTNFLSDLKSLMWLFIFTFVLSLSIVLEWVEKNLNWIF